jgi:hypothetical protein
MTINPIIRSRTRYFHHVYPTTRAIMLLFPYLRFCPRSCFNFPDKNLSHATAFAHLKLSHATGECIAISSHISAVRSANQGRETGCLNWRLS